MSKSATADYETPLVSVGEKIKLTWTEEDGSSRTIHARVQNIEKSSTCRTSIMRPTLSCC